MAGCHAGRGQGRRGTSGWEGVRTQAGGVLAGRGAEQAAVLAVELCRTVIAGEMPDPGDVAGVGDQQ